MLECEYDGSTTESETFDGEYESDVEPFQDVKTESINILALGDALASQYVPQSVSAAPTLPAAAAVSGVSVLEQEPIDTMDARVESELSLAKAASEPDAVTLAVSEPKAEAHAASAAVSQMPVVQPIAEADIEPRPHPTCTQCGNLLALGSADVEVKDKAQCSCCKQILPCNLYSKTQLGKAGKRRCMACAKNQSNRREIEAAMAHLPLVCRACLKSLPFGEFSRSQRSNESTRRCKSCVESKYAGNMQRPVDAKKAAQKQSMFEHQVAKIKMAWRALERKKAANNLRGSSRVAYEEQLAKEEKELKSRQNQLRNRGKRAFDEVNARLQVRDAVGLGSESDKNLAKKKIRKTLKNKKKDTKKVKKPSASLKSAVVHIKTKEKQVPEAKTATKRSSTKAGLKEIATSVKKPRLQKDAVKIQPTVVKVGNTMPIAIRTKKAPSIVSTAPAPRRNPPRGRAKPNEVIDLTED